MRTLLFLILLLVVCSDIQAQTSSNKKAQALFDKAQGFLKNDRYDLAVSSLNETVRIDPSFLFALIQLGDINRRLNDYEAAKQAYHSALAIHRTFSDVRAYYGLAEAELYTGDYISGLQHINIFIEKYRGNDPYFIRKAKKYQSDFKFSIEALKTPLKYEPLNMGSNINSPNREYFPSVTADGRSLIFSRKIDNNEDFYISEKKAGRWGIPTPLSDKINTSNFNEGAQCISPDGKYLIFTGCNRPDGFGRCDIYVSLKEGTDWGEPFNLGSKVNSQYWESQPTISPDGNTLYFVSNRPGGVGSYDLWKSTLQSNGFWGSPINLGPAINTPDDENTPFLHPDGKTLYFSSNGWPGLGKKDLFISRMDTDGSWTRPLNLGYPINTFNEETGLIVTPEGNEALFSADLKQGHGDMDIYSFALPLNKRPQPITYVKGIVRDKETGRYLDAVIRIVDLKRETNIYDDFSSAYNGEFLAALPVGGSYAFHVSMKGYLFYSENFQPTIQSINEPYKITIELSQVKVGSQLVLKNIFFNTNKFDLLPQSLTELSQLVMLLNDNTNIFMEIQGHTDNSGNDVVNQQLSLYRAKAVHDYLISNGIKPERLTYKGFGPLNPIDTNENEEGRQKNRRTSFLITKT